MLPQTKNYLKRAFLNEKFFESIDWDNKHKQHISWSTTVLFYSALHYFNAFICEKVKPNSIPNSHNTRKIKKKEIEIEGRTPMAVRILKVDLPQKGIHEAGTAYKSLFQTSQSSRYGMSADFLSEKDFKLAKKNYDKIKNIVLYELKCHVCDNPNKDASNQVCINISSREKIKEIMANI